MSEVNILNRCAGLNNRIDPSAIPVDHETGATDLTSAVDIIITDAHKIERRPTRKKLIDGSFHSGYSHAADLSLVVQENTSDAALMRFNPDETLTGLRSGLTKNLRMAYVRAGFWYYYCNTKENGVVKEDGLSYAWPSYDPPTEVTRELSPAPVGGKLAFLSGRIFVVVDDTIYWSLPHEPGLFDLERFVRHTSKVLMIKPVLGGMFVSTERETLFYTGVDPEQWDSIPVLPYPAIEWSDSIDYLQTSRLGVDMRGNSAFWFSENGLIAGLPSGDVINLTEDKMIYPESTEAAALLFHDKLIYTMR